MKKILVLIAAPLLLGGSQAAAQEWKDALKRVATAAADKATDGKLTQYALQGNWEYTAPGVKFEGEDMLSELGGAAAESTITSRLEKAYLLAGIQPGAASFSFNDDETFTAQMGRHCLSGTYTFDPTTHVITLRFAKGKLNLGTVPGHAYVSGGELLLVFPVTKLVDLITSLGSRISALKSVSRLLENYKDVYIGFRFATKS